MTIGAEAFVSPVLQSVIDLIFSEGVLLFRKLTGGELDDTLREWDNKLKLIKAVLDDAEHKHFQSRAVQQWLRDLQDLAFDMEDILNDFAIQGQEHQFNTNMDQRHDIGGAQGVFGKAKNMVACIPGCFSTMFKAISPDIQSKIKSINKRLHGFSRTELLSLSITTMQQQAQQTDEALRRHRESSSLEPESSVFERGVIKEEIITRLWKDDDPSNENYVVIPIVGRGGIGKTTLAQCVYNDEQLKDHFNLMAWVCVSDVFDVKRITTTIFKAFAGRETAFEFNTLDEAQSQLKQVLMGKKFLIVLDDIWNDEYFGWSQLQTPFNHAAKGSRVIVTTRNEGTARIMMKNQTHRTIIKVKGLSDNECWHLFQQHANDDPDLTDMRDNIIKKCQGLPLAAKALGGLFKKTVDDRQRHRILENNSWSEESGVLPVLRLSYNYLPAQLKRIFAYFSLFPKDYKFKEKEVILLWMAQGYLQHDENMEDLGHNYFSDLESRSLIEQCPWAARSSDKGSFIMHDLIHDLALWAADGICYAKGTKDIAQVNRERIRHVYLSRDATMQERQLIASQLRTFYDDETITNLDFVQSFIYIRALKLASPTIEVLPECIGDLKHLRFLSLIIESLKELPKSISKLWNLQTLCLKGCSKLRKVPNIGSLKKLRHLDITSLNLHEMPEGIGKLTNLKSLGKFILDNGHGFRVRELKNLNNLQGELTISGVGNVTKVEDAKEAQLHEKCGLNKLYLRWGTDNEQVGDDIKREVAEQLKPPTSIKKCELVGYRGLTLPSWLGDPSFNKMVDIRLSWCKKCERLPPLGQLPCLKSLDIIDMDNIKRVGVEFYGDVGCSNPFPVLETLRFFSMGSWEKWEHIPGDNNRAFPCLERLEIMRCPHLERLPSEMNNYTSLQFLHINHCPKLQCFPEGGLPENLKQVITKGKINRLHSIVTVQEQDLNLSLPSCYVVDIENKHNLKNLSFVNGTNLEKLSVNYCLKLESLVGNFTSLEQLTLEDCPQFHSLAPLDPTSIKVLHLSDLGSSIDTIEQIPGLDLHLPSSLLELEVIRFDNLKNLSFVNGTNLKKLWVYNCLKLESLVGNFTSLKVLSLTHCPKLQSLPPLVSTSIQELGLRNLGSITDEIKQIPGPDFHLPSSLRILSIEGFQNLKRIRCSTLPNLTFLSIEYCPKFESFGDIALPPQIEEVYIEECEMTKPHLQSDPHNGIIWMDNDYYSLC